MKKFEQIIVVGFSRVATECIRKLKDFFKQDVTFYEFKPGCNKTGLDEFLKNKKDSFIVSANNFYIFKQQHILNNIIINYHNSILPSHKGSNPNIWSIYENDKKSGITWHFVDNNIDTGAVILQKEITIDSYTTALSLLIAQNKLAIERFSECLSILCEANFDQSKFVSFDKNYGITRKREELPNNGILDISESKEKIFRFLRAMDCGFLSNVKKPIIKVFDSFREVKYYEIHENYLVLQLDGDLKIKLDFKRSKDV